MHGLIRLQFIFLFTCIIQLCSVAQLSSGPRSGSAFSDDNTIGVYGIGSAGNAAASDDNRASASAILTLLSGDTHYLKAMGFGFSIPFGSLIRGIVVDVEKSAVGINLFAFVNDNSVRLVKGGTITGTDHASGSVWSSTEAYHTYGNSTDLWGTTWTVADINSGNFGVVFSASITGLITLLPSARIDHIRVTVYYDFVVVPLQITGFSGEATDEHIAKLNWSTLNNEDGALVSLQRSYDGLDWITIYQHENVVLETAKKWQYTDHGCKANTALYRLCIRYRSGQFNYSSTLKLEWEPEVFRLYPNPATDFIFITQKEPPKLISCRSMDGQYWPLTYSVTAAGIYRANIRDLPPGTYILTAGKKSSLFLKI